MNQKQPPPNERRKRAEKTSAKVAPVGARDERWEVRVRKRAYEIYLARKGAPGSAEQDWLQAEGELLWKLEH